MCAFNQPSGAGQKFLNGAMTLIDCAVRIGVCPGIGVCNRNSAERLSCSDARLRAAFEPKVVPQRVVFIRVSMGPAIYCDRGDIFSRVEPAGREGSRQLVADIALECLERCIEKLEAA